MNIAEIRKTLRYGNNQQLELMARGILCRGRSHGDMKDLSHYANEFNDVRSRIDAEDQDYLALVFILTAHLNEMKNGACACSIIQKPMYNSPERLGGILEIIEEKFVEKDYIVYTHSRCLACGKEYESKTVESGLGQKVIWSEYR